MKVYKSGQAAKLHSRPVKSPPKRPAKRLGAGKHAHPQPRGSQERKGKY